jgi:virulence factor Mce-like protein
VRGKRSGVFATFASSPVLVGAITSLIAAVAVFLAYNANNGLPFVKTYRITAQVPDAASLVPGNEVRIAGVRIGAIESIEPVQDEDGTVHAKIDLKLEGQVDPLPKDSTVIVRAKSALGLKYLELVQGTSKEGYGPGAVMPLSAAHPEPVDIDQLLNTFDPPTRLAIRQNLNEFGTALGGRGVDLNQAIGELRPLVVRLQPVMANLSSPRTALGGFFRALEATAAEVAPAAETQAQLFVALDATFGALAGVARPFIQETISETPPTLDVANQALPVITPFLDDSAALFADLQPGAEALRTSSPVLARALAKGVPALRRSPQLNAQIPPTAQSLADFSANSGVRAGIDRLTRTNAILDPLLAFVTPAQSVCNYGTLLFRNAASALSLGDGVGTWQRFILFATPDGTNNEGSPASAPANGGGDPRNFLHVNPYPNSAAPGQPRECEAGNESFIAGQRMLGNVPGNQGIVTQDQP